MTDDEFPIRIESVGRGKSKIIVEHLGRSIAATIGTLADRRERLRVAEELLADAPGLGREELLEAMLEAGARAEAEAPPAASPSTSDNLEPSTEAELAEAIEILRSGDLVDQIEADITEAGVVAERALKLTVYLVATSRLLIKPTHAMVIGTSSSGKTHVCESVARLMPPEAVLIATHVSPKALYKIPSEKLRHRFLVMGERSQQSGPEAADATRALRQLRSDGRLSELNVTDAGEHVERIVEGPVASIETTTLLRDAIFDEDRNRCVILSADESREKARHVLSAKLRRYAGAGRPDTSRIRRRHLAIQRLLADGMPFDPILPFAERLGAHWPDNPNETLRALDQFLGIVQASAVLHRFQRSIDEQGRIVADLEDYALARSIVGPAIEATISKSAEPRERRVFEELVDRVGVGNEFTRTEAAAWVKLSPSTFNDYVSGFIGHGVVCVTDRKRGRSELLQLAGDRLGVALSFVPAPEALR